MAASRTDAGMSPGFSALGGGDRAATCIGRAVRLCLINLFDIRPGGIDRSTLGHPGKLSYCLAEDEEWAIGPEGADDSPGDGADGEEAHAVAFGSGAQVLADEEPGECIGRECYPAPRFCSASRMPRHSPVCRTVPPAVTPNPT